MARTRNTAWQVEYAEYDPPEIERTDGLRWTQLPVRKTKPTAMKELRFWRRSGYMARLVMLAPDASADGDEYAHRVRCVTED